MKALAVAAALAVSLDLAATTIHNDNSCDIGNLPAATLLLPYFEVDLQADRSHAADTLFSVVNVSRNPQIARATVWTNLGYPVFTFNIFLGGYDVQSYSMYDLLSRGVIAKTTIAGNHGPRSMPHDANGHFDDDVASQCGQLPENIPASLLADIQNALTNGTTTSCAFLVGLPWRSSAVGYVTIDLVANCGSRNATQAGYFEHDLLFDNVLTGDYEKIAGGSAQASSRSISGLPLVHIRAIPEGGPAGLSADVPFPVTFYDRLTPSSNHKVDRRQPLPSLFAARYVWWSDVDTDLQIWHEPILQPGCGNLLRNYSQMIEAVRFDEHENSTTTNPGCRIPECTLTYPTLPVTTMASTATSDVLPPDTTVTSDMGGWIYLNLSTPAAELGANSSRRTTQNWVSVRIEKDDHSTIMFDATQLGNGCTPNPGKTDYGANPVGPAANTNVRGVY